MIEQFNEALKECKKYCKKKGLSYKILCQNGDTETLLVHIYSNDYSKYVVYDKCFYSYDSQRTAYIAYLEAQHFTVMLLEHKGDVALYAVRHPVDVTTYFIWANDNCIDTYSLKGACYIYYKESGQTI